MNVDDWDAYYRAAAGAPRRSQRSQPDPLVEAFAGGQPAMPANYRRRALDLACGTGANALWLAERGWDVTAVDRSPAAIELVRAEASERGVQIASYVADLEAHEFEIAPEAWDLILMCRYLQRDLFEPAKFGLAKGGLLIVIALLAVEGSAKQRFRVQPGELAKYFGGSTGWTIVHQREGATRDHQVAEIVVRRDR